MIVLPAQLLLTLLSNSIVIPPTASWPGSAHGIGGEEPLGSTFDYDFVEGGFAFGDLDGLRLGASLHLDGPWIALGRFEFSTEDEGNADVDLGIVSGGVGYVYPAQHDLGTARPLDFIGSAELELGHAEIDTPAGSSDDDDIGLRLRAGVRFQATKELELAGGVSVRTLFDEDLVVDGKALYAFDEHFAGFVGFEHGDDRYLTIGVRYGL